MPSRWQNLDRFWISISANQKRPYTLQGPIRIYDDDDDDDDEIRAFSSSQCLWDRAI